MAIKTIATTRASGHDTDEHVIDLRGHRLADLIQVLSGCDPERAELAVGTHEPGTCVNPDDALDTLARALVQLRCAATVGTAGTAGELRSGQPGAR
jgi:hypothetical protein